MERYGTVGFIDRSCIEITSTATSRSEFHSLQRDLTKVPLSVVAVRVAKDMANFQRYL